MPRKPLDGSGASIGQCRPGEVLRALSKAQATRLLARPVAQLISQMVLYLIDLVPHARHHLQ